MNRHNVPLNGLRVFEASARHLNFTSAAEELNISQAAVSQQIRGLESQLGTQLFSRQPRNLALTPHGQELLAATRPALDSINSAIERILGTDNQEILTVTTLPSFASRWLIPRLDSFQQANHNFELHLHTSEQKTDLIGGKVDAAIRLDAKEAEGLMIEFLVPDALCLVATPDLAEKIGSRFENLYEQPLSMDGIRFSPDHRTDMTGRETEDYLQALPLDKRKLKITEFSASDNVVLSALSGKSTALTRLSLCVDELDAGRLQILFDLCKPLTHGTSFVYPKVRSNDNKLLIFKEWLHKEAKIFNDRLANYCQVQE
ncbi:hypothetical protein AB833_27750 [Chromatiales bacterium (ex Bugula neritina AB1)]|nr:hypothetical protein AB833_27750 [Chromatiales bacterium (ex Bugula neritina AB1)]